MKHLFVIIGVIIAYFAWLKVGARAKIDPGAVKLSDVGPTLDELYETHGRQKGLDPMLLKAIAQVESNENPNAKNPTDPSYGLMQLLCQDDAQGGCRNRLNVLGWPPATKVSLYDPDYSLHIGAQILAWNIEKYGFMKGVAVYNSWSARLDPDEGPFSNQGYVDKVLGRYAALRPAISYEPERSQVYI